MGYECLPSCSHDHYQLKQRKQPAMETCLQAQHLETSESDAPLAIISAPITKSERRTTKLPLKATTETAISSSTNDNPVQLLKVLFARHDATELIPKPPSGSSTASFQKPSKGEMAAYDMETCTAVRKGDIDKLRSLHYEQGRSLDGSNQFGESLLHMACRRGDKVVVEFLLREAQVSSDVRDDMGRNVYHDACWTSKPNMDVMDVLLQTVSPGLLLAPDVRGHTPFDYARKNHWRQWSTFLQEREDVLQRRLAICSSSQ
jgi:hypothetical protein